MITTPTTLHPAAPAVRARRPHVRSRALAVALSTVGAAAAFCVIYLFFVRSVRGQFLDERALTGGLWLSHQGLDAAVVDLLDQVPAMVGVTGALGVLVLAAARRRVAGPAIAVTAGLVAIAATQLLKHVLLTRPDHGISDATMNSFPSGHTTAASAAMLALVLAAPPASRAVVSVFGALAAGLAGASTVLVGWHRPSDVIGALLLTAVVGLPAAAIVHAVESRSHHRGSALDSAGSGRAGRVLCAVTIGLGALLAGAATVAARPWAAVHAEKLRYGTDFTAAQDTTGAVLLGLSALLGAALVTLPLVGLFSRTRVASPAAA